MGRNGNIVPVQYRNVERERRSSAARPSPQARARRPEAGRTGSLAVLPRSAPRRSATPRRVRSRFYRRRALPVRFTCDRLRFNAMNCMKALIEAVRGEQCLWNPTHPEYREPIAKEAAWERVVDAINDSSICSPQIAKTEWKKLRDNHRDALKRAKLGKNKLLPAQITTWKYAKAMQFLEPHMKYRITENIEMDLPHLPGNSNPEHDVSTTELADNNMYDHTPVKKSRTDAGKHTSNQREMDTLGSFFNCILQSTRAMPPWMQTQVKKKIFQVVIESEEYLSQNATMASSTAARRFRERHADAPESQLAWCAVKTEMEDDDNTS
ncbi:hypothetical protein EVAR_39835_1 [Eumeta japonica]|uniref:MADF domain-containing protein n=1 Tax=Eumeta variegata TaxID=151549 RepID=A0A4C1X7A9_EUMVA|nr:hypothetical protein EVAR_39835_1 [Eumeta japonica]